MLCCTAQEMCQLSSWNCRIMLKNVLNWYWVDFCSAQTVNQIAADSSDELAVLGQSLNSVGCSLSLDSLTRCNMTSSAYSIASHPLSSRWCTTKLITTPMFVKADYYAHALPVDSYYAHIVLYAQYSLLCSKLCPPNRRSPTEATDIQSGVHSTTVHCRSLTTWILPSDFLETKKAPGICLQTLQTSIVSVFPFVYS